MMLFKTTSTDGTNSSGSFIAFSLVWEGVAKVERWKGSSRKPLASEEMLLFRSV